MALYYIMCDIFYHDDLPKDCDSGLYFCGKYEAHFLKTVISSVGSSVKI